MNRGIFAGLICTFLMALSGCASMSVDRLTPGTSMITTGGSTGKWQEIPMTTIQLKDLVYMLTYVQWEPVDQSAGSHDVIWTWQRDGKVIYRCESKDLEMKRTPYRLWCRTQAAGLGTGHIHVTVNIDGRTFSEKEFDIVETAVDETAKAQFDVKQEDDIKTSGPSGRVIPSLSKHCPNALQISRDIGFPNAAFESGLHEGSVVLAILISPGGSLKNIRVVSSSHESFNQAALDMAAGLKCNGEGFTQDTEIRWEIAYKAK